MALNLKEYYFDMTNINNIEGIISALDSFDINKNNCNTYKKIYNDYCNISEQSRKNYNIEIKEYTLEKKKTDINENKDMELTI